MSGPKAPHPVVLVGGRFEPLERVLQAAFRAHQGGRLGEAQRLYDSILLAAPADAGARQGRGVLRLQRGDAEGARQDLEQARQARPGDAGLLVNLGQVLLACKRPGEARQCFAEAAGLAPDDSAAHLGLGNACRLEGALAEAASHFGRAAELDPGNADAWLSLGALENERDRPAAALRCFEAAAAARPDGESLALVAATQERAGRLEESAAAAQRALERVPGHPGASLTLARVRRRSGDWAAARDGFAALADRFAAATAGREARVGAAAAQELALVLEREGRYEEAWRHFVLANRIQHAANPRLGELAARFRDQVAGLRRAYSDDAFVGALPRRPPGTAGRSPVFLVGFPRSGTTLLVRALASHPGAAVLDEKPVLESVLKALAAEGVAYPRGLPHLGAEAWARLRAVYWHAARQFLPEGTGEEALLVDKDPINSIHVGLIRVLFPDSPIVFSIRDPRDACLSCFGNIFRLTPALATFNTLEGAAESFAAVSELWQLYGDRLPLRSHVLRYEELVADFAGRMRDLLAFVGLPWDDAVLSYHRARNPPLVRTPSYDQVSRPPYLDSIGRWRHYAEHFEPCRTILYPALRRFGYDWEGTGRGGAVDKDPPAK